MEKVQQGRDVANNLYFNILTMNPSITIQIKVSMLSFIPMEI